jgi:hypothetical protein
MVSHEWREARYSPPDLRREIRQTFCGHRSRSSQRLFSDEYVSRSEARRMPAGLHKFKIVELGFHNVRSLGQGFAHEVFRVFATANPHVEFRISNLSPALEPMLRHVVDNDRIPGSGICAVLVCRVPFRCVAGTAGPLRSRQSKSCNGWRSRKGSGCDERLLFQRPLAPDQDEFRQSGVTPADEFQGSALPFEPMDEGEQVRVPIEPPDPVLV